MRRTVALLGASQALEYAAQLLLPILLVRLLTPEEFGGYRVAWLLAQTAIAALTMNLAYNLVYQAAKQPALRHSALFGNACAYFGLVGLATALAIGPFGLGARLLGVDVDADTPWLIAGFVFFWIASQPLETIALMVGRPMTQARLALVSTLTRVALVGAAALATRSLDGVVMALAVVAVGRAILLATYARRGAQLRWAVDPPLARWQLVHAFGFGLGASLFALRVQVDPWIAALMIDQRAVAMIAVAASVAPAIGIARAAFTNAALPSIARAVAQERLADALSLNRRINLQVTSLLAPVVGGLIALAPELLSIAYTTTFEPAATPLRLYLIGYAAALIETTTLIQSLGYGRFVLLQGAMLLVLSATLGLIGAHVAGIDGIAVGAAVSAVAGALMNMALLVRRHAVAWRDVQDWSMLARLAAASAFATAVTLWLLSAMPGQLGPWARLLVGSASFIALWSAVTLADLPLRSLYLHMLRRSSPAAP
jgi:lipopolysaccharide exporter